MNLLLITIDCLRADHLSCVGYRKNTTPFIDSLANKGTVYTNVFANGLGTAAAFPAIMTSVYPSMSIPYKTTNVKAIAEVLRDRGYKTAGFNENPFLTSYFGYDRGFDYFEDFIRQGKDEKSIVKAAKKKIKAIIKSKKLGNFSLLRATSFFLMFFSLFSGRQYMDGKNINRRTFYWLEKNYKDSFFLWLHYMDVHDPHQVPKEYIQRVNGWCPSIMERIKIGTFQRNDRLTKREIDVLKAIYDGEIRYVDSLVNKLYKKLTSLGIMKDTTIMIAADHGEEFFEHGGYHRYLNFHDEMLRTPLVIYGPNIPTKRIDKQVEHIDIAPTILDILCEPKENSFIGKSLLGDNSGSKYVITETVGGKSILKDFFNLEKISVRAEDGMKWKYIFSVKSGEEELYNLSIDPFEKDNQAKTAEKMLEYLRNKVRRHIMNKPSKNSEARARE